MASAKGNKKKDPKKKVNINPMIWADISVIAVIIVLDRIIKIYATNRLKDHPGISLIKKVLELTYLENNGAAFGLLKGQRSFFIFVSALIFIAVIFLFYKMPNKKKFRMAHIALSMLTGGIAGNLIDRIFYNYVIDYIYFSSIHFPIFNIADFFVSIGTVIIIVLLLFVYSEDDLNFLRITEKKLRDIK